MKMTYIISLLMTVGSNLAYAKAGDGSDIPSCAGVTNVCMAAQVSAVDTKTGKTVTGYQPGEHNRDGKGLWADCVAKLASGSQVEGVSGVTQDAAKACLKDYHAAHPKKK